MWLWPADGHHLLPHHPTLPLPSPARHTQADSTLASRLSPVAVLATWRPGAGAERSWQSSWGGRRCLRWTLRPLTSRNSAPKRLAGAPTLLAASSRELTGRSVQGRGMVWGRAVLREFSVQEEKEETC